MKQIKDRWEQDVRVPTLQLEVDEENRPEKLFSFGSLAINCCFAPERSFVGG
jgi:hypothetical protein